MRESDRLYEIKSATLSLRRLLREIDQYESDEKLFERVRRRIRHWPAWIKCPRIVQTVEFEDLIRELKKIHRRRMRLDGNYRKRHLQITRRKKRILYDAEKLQLKNELASINYVIPLLYRRWMQSGVLFQPYEFELWTEFQNTIHKLKSRITKHRTHVVQIREQSAQLRYEIIQESRTLNPEASEIEIRLAVQNLIKKWKEIPQVDVYQEQRFWRWTEKGFDVLFKRSV